MFRIFLCFIFKVSITTQVLQLQLIFNFLCFFYFSGIDVTPYLKTIPYLGEKLDSSSTAGASTFVIAYAVNKGEYEKI